MSIAELIKKKVITIIEVPKGKFCWEYKTNQVCDTCDWLNIRHGPSPACDLKFQGQRDSKKGIRKSPDCIKLEKLSAKAIKSVARCISDTGGVMSSMNNLRNENSPEARAIIKLYDDAVKQEKIARRGDSDLAFEYWGAVTFTLEKVANRIIKEREKS